MPTPSFWEKESFYPSTDVIIVGAGLLGLWTAWELLQKNKELSITILERAPVPLGASTRNAGFACFGSPTELLHNAATMGTDAMLDVVEMRFRGIQKIRQHFSDTVIGFDPCGGYECIDRSYTHWDTLNDKIMWLNDQLKSITGNAQVFTRCDKKLPSLGLTNFDALIENVTEATLHSGKLVTALTEKVRAAGATILYGSELMSWEKSIDGIGLRTSQQVNLHTNKLVFCTNGFTRNLLPAVNVTPARGQVIVTSPIKGLALRGSFHFDEGFYYWRDLGERILIGGGRNTAFVEETTTDLAGSETVKQALLSFLETHLDEQYHYTIEHHWSGIMAFTDDRKPMVTEITQDVYAAVACNGMGVALTPVIAEQVAGLVAKHF